MQRMIRHYLRGLASREGRVDCIRLDKSTPPGLGGKGDHLRWLLANGFRVPETWVIPAGVPRPAPAGLPTGEGPWAVRSSATVEDGFESSYAGQFASVLDVQGVAEVTDAIELVRKSADAANVTSYRTHRSDSAPVEMAVLIQRMVDPRASGVALSRNPMTGLNEVVVEAVAGRGDALVDAGVTPQRWIERWGDWSVKPDGVASVIPEPSVREIVRETRRAAQRFGSPVDLEWVWDGADVWWVQLRPITGLDEVAVYSNRISREVMPGMIKPLVWSINVPVVNKAWIGLFTEFIGPNDLRPEDLAKSFAYRSYFNMGAIGDIFEILGMPRDALEMLLGIESDAKPRFRPTVRTMRHLPRLVRASTRMARHGKRVEDEVDNLTHRYRSFEHLDIGSLTDRELLARVDDLAEVTTRAAYQNIVTPVLANLYSSLLRSAFRGNGFSEMDVDLELGDPDNPHDPNRALARLAGRLDSLSPATRDRIAQEGVDALPDVLRSEFDDFLTRFGHLSDSGNDFSVPAWRERPEVILKLALDHGVTVGSNHHRPWSEVASELGPVRRRIITGLQRRASGFVDHRESVSSMYTFGYGQFRPLLLELGRRLADRGEVNQPEDVMYLYLEEARRTLLGELDLDCGGLVARRRNELEELAEVEMPEVIFGDDFIPARSSAGPATRLSGVATSRGRYRGTLRLITGIEDSSKVEPGDVIAVPFSDVGWTPLFARAGAVIAEAGGMLSHSSIVAREFRIPCVVSVSGATRLPDGATVVVDGYTGTVTVEG